MRKLFTLLTLGSMGVGLAMAAPANQDLQKKAQLISPEVNRFDEKKAEPVFNFTMDDLKAARMNTRAEWTDLGSGYYRECLCSSVFRGVPQQDIPVEMYQTTDEYGTVYRLENPYANWVNPFSDLYYDFDGQYDMYIHVVPVDGVDYIFIEDFTTGLEAEGMGGMYLMTQLGSLATANPDKIAEINEMYPGGLGTLTDGIMSYPIYMTVEEDGKTSQYYNFLVGFTMVTDGYYAGNTSKTPFAVTLPGYEPPAEVDPFDVYTYIGEGTFYNNLMTPFLEEAPDDPYTVGIYCEENNPYYLHIRNAWGEWHDAESKDTDFDLYFPYNSLTQSWYTNCAMLPSQTTGYNDLYFGEIDIIGIAYLYVNYTEEFDGPEDFYATYPGNCISLDFENKQINFPKECVLYDFDYNDTNQYQTSNPNYQFDGYLKFPADYVFPNPGDAGVHDIAIDNANGPVKYYNLQGVEISNPVEGQIVIKKQGSKSQKVMVK